MFARTVMMRLRATRTMLGVSPFLIFVKKSKGALPGIGGRRRGKQLAKLYKALPKAELTKLKTEAARTPFKRSCVKRAPKTRKPHKFAKFVAANYKSVRSVPYKKRLAALAAKWKKTQK